MEDRIKDALVDDLEITVDFFDNPSVHNVFLGELMDRKADFIDALIDTGNDEYRYKIQMINEIIEIRDDVMNELKARKDQME